MNKNDDKFWELATSSLHDELSDKESEELKNMLVDEKNKKLFSEIEKIKANVKQIESLQNFSQDKSWKSISKQIRSKTIQLVWNVTKYAAIIAVAFLLGKLVNNQNDINTDFAKLARVYVPHGQMTEMTMFDGTKVWLNSGTTLKYSTAFGVNERNVILDGEAFFEVQKNEIPFKVQLKNSEVEVLGTAFNVISYKEEDYSRITLVNGQVAMNNLKGNEIAKLEPNQQITLNDDSPNKAILKHVDTEFYTTWKEGKIVIDNEKLSDISSRLERWYNIDIRFKDSEAGEFYFSGTILKHKPFNQIIDAFELLLPIEIDYKTVLNGKDIVTISKK
ncbi:MAG: FecR domain-containing protein [Draconibacterium sp.]|nr:FecR domain-containing protein [Draconibacterium sp.]